MQTFASLNDDFIISLISNGCSADIEPAQDIYARLLGNWKLKIIDYYPDGGTQRNQTGTWHFARTLEGRAIQDVLVSPELADRSDSKINRRKPIWKYIQNDGSENPSVVYRLVQSGKGRPQPTHRPGRRRSDCSGNCRSGRFDSEMDI